MDKTIKPNFDGTSDSISIPTNKKLLLKQTAPSENRDTRVIVDLPPSIYLVTGSGCQEFPLDPDEYKFTVGRSEDATVTINDNTLSPTHLTIMKVKDECLFMDRGKRDLLSFDGIPTRQAFTPVESRLVVKLGQHWLIYEASNILSTDTVSINQELIADSISQEEVPGSISLFHKGREWTSTRNNCLIGSHALCDVRLHSDSIADFTCMLYWKKEGVFIERMGQCRAAVCVDGARINNPVKLQGGETITIGREEIDVVFDGDIDARCANVFKHVKERPEMALTVLSGAESKTYPLNPNSMYTLGRISTADLYIDSPSVSRTHCKLMVRDKLFSIQDNESFNKTILNREEIDKATVFAGDLLELGDVALLAHFNVIRF